MRDYGALHIIVVSDNHASVQLAEKGMMGVANKRLEPTRLAPLVHSCVGGRAAQAQR
jgi:hypothetical protein